MEFGCTPDVYWVEPGCAEGTLRFRRGDVDQTTTLDRKRITFPRHA